jgi:predicted transposase/invertase (TIGR01784 family)
MASEVLLSISKDEVERARLASEYKYQLDMQSKLVHAKREALQEGLQQGKLEIARKMKSRGIAVEQIVEDTGLTLKQIEDL